MSEFEIFEDAPVDHMDYAQRYIMKLHPGKIKSSEDDESHYGVLRGKNEVADASCVQYAWQYIALSSIPGALREFGKLPSSLPSDIINMYKKVGLHIDGDLVKFAPKFRHAIAFHLYAYFYITDKINEDQTIKNVLPILSYIDSPPEGSEDEIKWERKPEALMTYFGSMKQPKATPSTT